MQYVGLDVHAKQWTYVILDANGKKVRTRSDRGTWDKLLQQMSEIKGPFRVCFEASTGYGHLFGHLHKIAEKVSVAHPGQLALIFRSKKKNDRCDAEKLAKLLFLDEVPTVHVPSVDTRAWRRMIEYRQGLVNERTRLKCQVRALLRTHGISAPKNLWSKKNMDWLQTVEFGGLWDNLQRDTLVEGIASHQRRIARVEKALNEMGAKHPGVRLLMTIPGVGPRTAEAVMAYVDDPARFSSAPRMASYFGLVPSQKASGGRNQLGPITKDGPATPRRLLVEAAWQGIRRSPVIRAYFERIRRGDDERRKIAVVATAHYLVRVMYAMLTSGELWREAV